MLLSFDDEFRISLSIYLTLLVLSLITSSQQKLFRFKPKHIHKQVGDKGFAFFIDQNVSYITKTIILDWIIL